jgi:hypothetical protein
MPSSNIMLADGHSQVPENCAIDDKEQRQTRTMSGSFYARESGSNKADDGKTAGFIKLRQAASERSFSTLGLIFSASIYGIPTGAGTNRERS